MMNDYYMERRTLPAINEIFPQFNHRSSVDTGEATATTAATAGVAANFILSPLDLSLRPGANLVPITPPTTPTPISTIPITTTIKTITVTGTAISTLAAIPFTPKRQRLMSNENHLWRPHVSATSAQGQLSATGTTTATTTITTITTKPLEYSHNYLPCVNLAYGKCYDDEEMTLSRYPKYRRQFNMERVVGQLHVDDGEEIYEKHKQNMKNTKLTFNRASNSSEMPENQRVVMKHIQGTKEIAKEKNGHNNREEEWQKLQKETIYVDDDNKDDDSKDDDDITIILTEDEEELEGDINDVEDFYQSHCRQNGQDDDANSQRYNRSVSGAATAIAKATTKIKATCDNGLIKFERCDNDNNRKVVMDAVYSSHNADVNNKRKKQEEEKKEQEKREEKEKEEVAEDDEIEIEDEDEEYVDILSNDDDILNVESQAPNGNGVDSHNENILMKLRSQADFERELEQSGKVLTRNKLVYDNEEMHLNAVNGLERLFNRNFSIIYYQSATLQGRQHQEKQYVKNHHEDSEIYHVDQDAEEVNKEKTYIDLTNCQRSQENCILKQQQQQQQQQQLTETIIIDDCIIAASTATLQRTPPTFIDCLQTTAATTITIQSIPLTMKSSSLSLASTSTASSSSYRTYKTERKRMRLRKQISLDEETISPVSGTIIRKLRDDEELVIRKGDIDPEFNVVEITEEAKAILASIDNKIGAYLCQLCRTVYDDAFKLAQHRCPRIVHIEYKCTECDKVFNCPANLASHRRWHKPKSGLLLNNQAKKRLNPEIFSFQNNPNAALEKSLREEDAYSCAQCGKSFRRLAYLKKHQMSHQMLESLKSFEFFQNPSSATTMSSQNDFQQVHIQNTEINVGLMHGNESGMGNESGSGRGSGSVNNVTDDTAAAASQRTSSQSNSFVNYSSQLDQLNAAKIVPPIRSFGAFPFGVATSTVANISHGNSTVSNANINAFGQQQRRFYSLSELYLSQQLERSRSHSHSHSRSSAFHQVHAAHQHYQHLNNRSATNLLPMPSLMMGLSAK